jgi:hypothetical protein
MNVTPHLLKVLCSCASLRAHLPRCCCIPMPLAVTRIGLLCSSLNKFSVFFNHVAANRRIGNVHCRTSLQTFPSLNRQHTLSPPDSWPSKAEGVVLSSRANHYRVRLESPNVPEVCCNVKEECRATERAYANGTLAFIVLRSPLRTKAFLLPIILHRCSFYVLQS